MYGDNVKLQASNTHALRNGRKTTEQWPTRYGLKWNAKKCAIIQQKIPEYGEEYIIVVARIDVKNGVYL